MFGGYVGKMLRINLINRKLSEIPLDPKIAEKFIGGMGLGIWVLYKDLKPKIDPLDPENELIFATGPLSGTLAPSSGTASVITKSPLTNTCLDSYASGFFGPELKFAGYDTVIIRGRASKPVYILINDGKAEIRDASHLWGQKTSDTSNKIREEIGDKEIKIACIGPAGENLVRFSSIITDRRSFGRGGSGAVMGSKKLKALAVRGSGDIKIADEKAFLEAVNEAFEIEKSSTRSGFLRDWMFLGTPGGLPIVQMAGILPTRNFSTGVFEQYDKLSGNEMKKRFYYRDIACYNCFLHCGKTSIIRDGPYADTVTEGPEYETMALLGSNCGIDYPEAVAHANLLCDEHGMDTMSTGGVIGFAMECYERGLINKEDTEGIDLRFGNHEALIQTIEKIALRKGFGNMLAEGVMRLSREIGHGSGAFAMHVKGLEFPSWDPRGLKGSGLAFATSHRGACHKRGIMGEEIFGKSGFSIENKAVSVKQTQDIVAVFFSLGVCRFATMATPLSLWAKLLTSATGIDFDEAKLMLAGERAENLTRLFNVREGFLRKDDNLPKRMMEEPMPEGPAKGQLITREELDKMLDEYYKLRGWSMDGVPTEEKLQELDLINV